MSKLLEGIKILDFSHRLPGPFAGHILAGLGAEVIKIEDKVFKDSFLSGLFSNMDKSFENWYEELNSNKKLLRVDFKSEEGVNEISKLIQTADGIILGLPEKIKVKLGLGHDQLKDKTLAIIEPLASKSNKKAMHDLNALAETGLLSLHIQNRDEAIVDPPMFPFAGISFGHKLATDLLACIIKSKIKKESVYYHSYLFETTQELFSPFWPKKDREEGRTKFLHNGLFPCYNLYRLKDGNYAALAAVEEKFWDNFCKAYKIDIDSKRRFDPKDEELFTLISSIFAKEESSSLIEKSNADEMCLSIVVKR